MSVHPEKITMLRQRASDEFRTAASHSGLKTPEGIAILMASGEVVAGHNVSNAYNAARQTLSVHFDFAIRMENQPVAPKFAIIAIAIATQNDKLGRAVQPSPQTLNTLRQYVGTPESLTVHGVSSTARGMDSQNWEISLQK